MSAPPPRARRWRAVAALLLAPLPALAWQTPQQAIDRYLAFEIGGGRLSAWPFERYIVAPEGYDEPGWDVVHPVRNARRRRLHCSGERCSVQVVFDYADTDALPPDWQLLPHPRGGRETLVYEVQRVPGPQGWRVVSVLGPPRVGMAALRALWPGPPLR